MHLTSILHLLEMVRERFVSMDALIHWLVSYGLKHKLFYSEDTIYVQNQILNILELTELKPTQDDEKEFTLQQVLDEMCAHAVTKGLIEDTQDSKDAFDTKIMNCLMPRPSEVIKKFHDDYASSPEQATQAYYDMSCASNYVRVDRIQKDKRWKFDTKYGQLDITINLSKPEKDPKDIEKAKRMPTSSYPKCLLCKENEGYAGHASHPARDTLRIIPLSLGNEPYYLQYSPYAYYHQHCIVFHKEHIPMSIQKRTFESLLSFVKQFPHYFIGSNADLPIVGGSILSHDHYQGGKYTFAMEQAKQLERIQSNQYSSVSYGRVYWPLSVIRCRSKDEKELVQFACNVLNKWKQYSDESLEIMASTNGTFHHTITPIARFKDNAFELDLVLRDNRTSEEHPDGIFHAHKQWHAIKKENIGLIEVMGLAVLPSRLKKQLEELTICLYEHEPLQEHLQIHASWIQPLQSKCIGKTKEEIYMLLQTRVSEIFLHVLEDAGVYKQDQQGQEGFLRFIHALEG